MTNRYTPIDRFPTLSLSAIAIGLTLVGFAAVG